MDKIFFPSSVTHYYIIYSLLYLGHGEILFQNIQRKSIKSKFNPDLSMLKYNAFLKAKQNKN